jgi:hypothetical protein
MHSLRMEKNWHNKIKRRKKKQSVDLRKLIVFFFFSLFCLPLTCQKTNNHYETCMECIQLSSICYKPLNRHGNNKHENLCQHLTNYPRSRLTTMRWPINVNFRRNENIFVSNNIALLLPEKNTFYNLRKVKKKNELDIQTKILTIKHFTLGH